MRREGELSSQFEPDNYRLERRRYAGGIAARNGEVLLILRAKDGKYGFAKGNIDPGEEEIEAAIRETKEETGVILDDLTFLGAYERLGSLADETWVQKVVAMYSGRIASEQTAAVLQDEREVWIAPALALPNMLPEEAAFLTTHLPAIMGQDTAKK